MKSYKILSIIVFVSLIIASCDKIEEPYAVPGDPLESNKVVLLEEFTGHKCINCPLGSEIAHGLKDLYGDRVIIISIHAGFFAIPDQTGDYTEDFRTETGAELKDYYKPQLYPSGMVSRTPYNDNFTLSKDAWAGAVTDMLALAEEATVQITPNYDIANRSLNIDVITKFLHNPEGQYTVSLYITGDTIAAQKNDDEEIGPTPDWLDYHHRDMLVQVLNGGTWGVLLNNGEQIIANAAYTTSFTGTLREGWPAERCKIVAFISNKDTKEVIQAAEVSIHN